MRRTVFRVALVLAVVVPFALGCSSSDDAGAPVGAPAAEQAKNDAAVVLDVRTPEEFSAGHVADATNLNFESPDFATNVAALDKGATYVIYCRSGRRSALAAEQMAGAGLTVLDAGAMQNMLDAGYQLG